MLILCRKKKQITIPEQLAEYVKEVIAKNGIGHVVTTKEIEDEIIRRYGSNRNSILPFDY
jgi:hypothetical protein